jgi:hypothetical protein
MNIYKSEFNDTSKLLEKNDLINQTRSVFLFIGELYKYNFIQIEEFKKYIINLIIIFDKDNLNIQIMEILVLLCIKTLNKYLEDDPNGFDNIIRKILLFKNKIKSKINILILDLEDLYQKNKK